MHNLHFADSILYLHRLRSAPPPLRGSRRRRLVCACPFEMQGHLPAPFRLGGPAAAPGDQRRAGHVRQSWPVADRQGLQIILADHPDSSRDDGHWHMHTYKRNTSHSLLRGHGSCQCPPAPGQPRRGHSGPSHVTNHGHHTLGSRSQPYYSAIEESIFRAAAEDAGGVPAQLRVAAARAGGGQNGRRGRGHRRAAAAQQVLDP